MVRSWKGDLIRHWISVLRIFESRTKQILLTPLSSDVFRGGYSSSAQDPPSGTPSRLVDLKDQFHQSNHAVMPRGKGSGVDHRNRR